MQVKVLIEWVRRCEQEIQMEVPDGFHSWSRQKQRQYVIIRSEPVHDEFSEPDLDDFQILD